MTITATPPRPEAGALLLAAREPYPALTVDGMHQVAPAGALRGCPAGDCSTVPPRGTGVDHLSGRAPTAPPVPPPTARRVRARRARHRRSAQHSTAAYSQPARMSMTKCSAP